jgi:hypothetical protein
MTAFYLLLFTEDITHQLYNDSKMNVFISQKFPYPGLLLLFIQVNFHIISMNLNKNNHLKMLMINNVYF